MGQGGDLQGECRASKRKFDDVRAAEDECKKHGPDGEDGEEQQYVLLDTSGADLTPT